MNANDSGDPVAKLLESMTPLELLRFVALDEAEHLSSLSADTLKREHPDKICKLSKRRDGMRVIHALMLNPANAPKENSEIA